MENKGIQIQKCPRCGKHGLVIERMTVTKNGNKRYTYKRLNVAHYAGYAFLRMEKQSTGLTGVILMLNNPNSYKSPTLGKTLHKMLHKTLDKTKTVTWASFQGMVVARERPLLRL